MSTHPSPVLTTRLMTADEVAALLQIDANTIYTMARARQIPSRRVGRRVRFLPAEINEWLEQQR